MDDHLIYHMCQRDEWTAAVQNGLYHGSSQDRVDGFIHFSTASQIVESAVKHRAGQEDLLLIAADPAHLRSGLRWEPSRNGQLFPHFYGALDPAIIRWAHPLPLGSGGLHIFPDALQDIERVS